MNVVVQMVAVRPKDVVMESVVVEIHHPVVVILAVKVAMEKDAVVIVVLVK